MKTLLATLLALTMLTAAVGPSLGSTEGVPDKVLGMLFTAEVVGEQVKYTLVTDPVLLPPDECLKNANEINNNHDVPFVMMCMPKINPPLAPAI